MVVIHCSSSLCTSGRHYYGSVNSAAEKALEIVGKVGWGVGGWCLKRLNWVVFSGFRGYSNGTAVNVRTELYTETSLQAR